MRLLITVIFGLLTGCGSSPGSADGSNKDSLMGDSAIISENDQLTPPVQSDSWQVLFDGSSRSGWHTYNNKSDGSAWKVADKTLYLDTSMKKEGRGDLVTAEEYGNFQLDLEWKISAGGNSGILIYVKEDAKFNESYFTGLEMQVLDNEKHSDAKIPKHRAGDLYDLIAGSPETVKPVGEWNKVTIISNNGALEFQLNGTSIVKTTLWNDDWKKMVAGSKFKEWSSFGTFNTGHIALQDHGDQVWYRNIRIKKL